MKKSVLFIVLIICLAMLAFTGCDLLQKAQNKMVEATIKTTVDIMLEKTIRETADAANADAVTEVAEHIRDKVTLKVTDSTISGDGMTAQCMVTAPDLKDFIKNFDASKSANEQEVCDAVIAAADSAPRTQTEITIGLQKDENGNFEPVDIESLIAAYLGTEDMDMVSELLSILQ